MNTLEKIIELMNFFPWKDFGATFLIIALIILLLTFSNIKDIRIFLHKLGHTFFKSQTGIILIASIFSVIFCSFFIIIWFKNINSFNSLENYIISLTLMLLFSLIFGTLAFLIHLALNNSFVHSNSNNSDFIKIDKKTYQEKISDLTYQNKVLGELQQLNLNRNIKLEFLGYSESTDENTLREIIQLKKTQNKETSVKVYKIENTEYYYIEIKTAHPRAGFHSENYILSSNQYFWLYNHIFSISDPWFSISRLTNEKNYSDKNQKRLDRIIQAQIKYNTKINIPALKDYQEKDFYRVDLFLYSYLLEFFGIGQSYIVPLNRIAKINHLVFGIYRFLMQGTFISLLIKDLANV